MRWPGPFDEPVDQLVDDLADPRLHVREATALNRGQYFPQTRCSGSSSPEPAAMFGDGRQVHAVG